MSAESVRVSADVREACPCPSAGPPLKGGQRTRGPAADTGQETLDETAKRLFGRGYSGLSTEQLVAVVADRRARKRAAASLLPPFSDIPGGGAA